MLKRNGHLRNILIFIHNQLVTVLEISSVLSFIKTKKTL